MIKVIGVRFRSAGKIYYFSPGELEIKTGDRVIVETARGVEYGKVVLGNRDVEDDKVIPPLKQVIRMATPADEEIQRKNREKAKEAYRICQEKIAKHELEMKLIDVEYTFDNNKILFYFTADGRVDFRELVKDLAGVFKTRIELRQIGVRDETKILGGIGSCGRPLCCHSYLTEFVPVSIKMAKEQNLSLNPTKISGVCGRLMCCLKNEEETYEYLNSKLPNVGDYVTAEDGTKGQVHSVSVLRQMVRILVSTDEDEKEIREYKISQLKFRPRRKKDRRKDGDPELRHLEALEKKEGKSKLDDN
ncbi:MAG: stage 0 sporulation family protein [Clostridium sp.]|nr:stage 0 sporulation family protein [Clostridium sp.]